MTGPHDSVIGVDRAAILQRFLTALPQRFETATENPRLNAVIVTADEATGRATRSTACRSPPNAIEALIAQPIGARLMAMDGRLPFDETRRRRPSSRPHRRFPPHAKPYTVSALTARLKALIELHIGSVAVEGEISNCRAGQLRPHLLHAEGRRARSCAP